jgi:2-C-methyl-D-erythritol 4-phosphate cytidylyltransferase
MEDMMSMSQGNIAALVVAAGKGSRMGTQEHKQYLLLNGTPILVHTLLAFEQSPLIDMIVLVVGVDDLERCRRFAEQYGISKLSAVVAGGNERQESVWRGIQVIMDEAQYVFIHDGVRPFIQQELMIRMERALRAQRVDALVAAVAVKDTIKMANESATTDYQTIGQTLPRERLWAIQTPQAFRMQTIVDAHKQAIIDGYTGTDDAVLVERLGGVVHIVQGDYFNIKITTPEDLLLAEAIIHRGKNI